MIEASTLLIRLVLRLIFKSHVNEREFLMGFSYSK